MHTEHFEDFDSEKDFCKLMNNPVFGKTMEDAQKHREIKLAAKDERRHYFVSESNYDATK